MEMTLIVVALLAAAGGLVVVAASGLRWAAAHRKDLLAAGHLASDRLRMQWPAGLAARLRPAWLFGVSAVLGLAVIASAAVGAGKLVEDVTTGDGVVVPDRPVARFVAAHRTGALTTVMRAASTAGEAGRCSRPGQRPGPDPQAGQQSVRAAARAPGGTCRGASAGQRDGFRPGRHPLLPRAV